MSLIMARISVSGLFFLLVAGGFFKPKTVISSFDNMAMMRQSIQ